MPDGSAQKDWESYVRAHLVVTGSVRGVRFRSQQLHRCDSRLTGGSTGILCASFPSESDFSRAWKDPSEDMVGQLIDVHRLRGSDNKAGLPTFSGTALPRRASNASRTEGSAVASPTSEESMTIATLCSRAHRDASVSAYG